MRCLLQRLVHGATTNAFGPKELGIQRPTGKQHLLQCIVQVLRPELAAATSLNM